jgi:hypothetical protein
MMMEGPSVAAASGAGVGGAQAVMIKPSKAKIIKALLISYSFSLDRRILSEECSE